MITQDTAGTAREGMTMDETTRLRALLERATPRPWSAVRRSILRHVDDAPDMVATASGSSDDAAADAALIVAAVNALPGLLDRVESAERERDDLVALNETRIAEHALAMERVRELEAIIAGRTTAALVSPQRPRIGDVVAFEGNRCTVTAVDEQRFYAEDHDWQTSIAPDWSEVEFARPVWIARFRGRGLTNGSKRGGAR